MNERDKNNEKYEWIDDKSDNNNEKYKWIDNKKDKIIE